MASARASHWFSPAALGLVIAGGALGVAVRAALVLPLDGGHPLLVPGVTLAVNIVGSFLLGAVVGALDDRRPLLRLFLGTGALGGFTTYSAFAVQVVTTSRDAPVVGLALAAVSVIVGVVAATAGLLLGRRVAGAPNASEDPEDAE